MKKYGKQIRAVLFLALTILCITAVSKVLEYEHEMEPGRALKEFYELERDEVQVLTVGSSHTMQGFSPLELYQKEQIAAYNLSTPKQPIELSYFLVKEGLKTQSPGVVIYNVASLFYTEEEWGIARLRYILDSMPLSVNKYHLAQCYASRITDQPVLFSIAEALCPLYFYHDRWKNLTEEDFDLEKPFSNLKGQYMTARITPQSIDPEKQTGGSDGEISDNNMHYFTLLKELCDENDIKLLLVATPTTRWNRAKENAVWEICDNMEINFVNLCRKDGELVDYGTDMSDSNHVNVHGARKLTDFLADYLMKHYDLKAEVCEDYEVSMKYYEAYNYAADFELETDFTAYLNRLNEYKENLVIFLAGKGEMMDGLQESDLALLEQLGCQLKFDKEYSGYSYGAVLDGGKNVFEEASDGEVSFSDVLDDGTKLMISSKGKKAGKEALIQVKGQEYAINGSGLNIVVYDKNARMVIDSVSFDTHSSDRQWYRGNKTEKCQELFIHYRDWVISNY